MKKRLQGLVAGILIGATITGGVVIAATETKTIEVLYNNIKVYKDNVLCELKDANGTVIEPFIYNGTTYMPVRGTANLAGMDVTWDGSTQSVYLWDTFSAEETYLMDVCPPYDGSRISTEDFKMAGNRYRGFTLWGNSDSFALINLNGKYSALDVVLGPEDGCSIEDTSIVTFILDGKESKSFEIETTDYPQTVTVPLNGALQLKIVSEADYNTTSIGFGNITIR